MYNTLRRGYQCTNANLTSCQNFLGYIPAPPQLMTDLLVLSQNFTNATLLKYVSR